MADNVSAGLPNLTSKLGFVGVSTHCGQESGFVKLTPVGTGYTWTESSSYYGVNWDIDASRGNAIYGTSATVQQSAIRLIPQLRY